MVFFLAGVFFVSNLDFIAGGDSIYYANIIDTRRFDQLTAHQAYYLLGFLCQHLFGWVAGLTTDQSMVVMSALFGAASLCVAYLLLHNYLGSVSSALLGTCMLFLCHRFYVNSTSSEVYIVQTFFIWSSFLQFEKRRFYLAGLCLAIAIWVSPLTLAYVLFFPVVAALRSFGLQSLLQLAVPVVLIQAPFFYFFYADLLWGFRGIIVQDELRKIDLLPAAHNFIRYQVKHYSFLNLLFIPALLALVREKRLLLISLAVALPNVYVIAQLRGEDNVFILALDVFFCYWLVIGWQVLRQHAVAWLGTAALLAHLVVFLLTETPFLGSSNKAYGDEFRAIGRIIKSSTNPVLFADWSRRMALVYYNRESAAYPLEEGDWYDLTFGIDRLENNYLDLTLDSNSLDATVFRDEEAMPGQFARYEEVFVLESYRPSAQARLFLTADSLEKRYERMSVRRQLERFLELNCTQLYTGILILYRCR